MTPALPPLPDHPEPQIMRWSDLELAAIRRFGEQCAKEARLAEREAIAEMIDASALASSHSGRPATPSPAPDCED
jgi:hypothetical protein